MPISDSQYNEVPRHVQQQQGQLDQKPEQPMQYSQCLQTTFAIYVAEHPAGQPDRTRYKLVEGKADCISSGKFARNASTSD